MLVSAVLISGWKRLQPWFTPALAGGLAGALGVLALGNVVEIPQMSQIVATSSWISLIVFLAIGLAQAAGDDSTVPSSQ